MSLALKSSHFILPVTALDTVSINNFLYICAGIGPRLLLVSEKNGRHLSQCDVLEHHCIHGIRIILNTDHTHWLVVFGQKAVTIVTIDPVYFNIKHITEVVELSDWILDVHWLRNTDQSVSHELAVITAHNNVLVWNWKKNECSEVACSEVNCILYSARCYGNTWDDLCVAVGTVFNEVLVWMVCGQHVNKRVLVAMTLRGHEAGVMCYCLFYSISLGSDILC